MKAFLKSVTLATGLAMFSMFFGAGNIIFPLVLGQEAADQNVYAILGLFITAIIVPFMGLLSMLLFEGNYRTFFTRIGKIPGYFFIFLVMLLIGPFAGMPRTIALSYSTWEYSGLGYLPFWGFNLVSVAVIFFCAYTRTRLVSILGYFLSPLLVIFLISIIVAGFMDAPTPEVSLSKPWATFVYGLVEGYNTLDLLASFFFSTVILISLRQAFHNEELLHPKTVLHKACKSALIAASLLTLIYVSMSFVSAAHSKVLVGVPNDQILAALSFHLLKGNAGLIASITTALTCLTTAITLAAVFASFLRKEIFRDRVSYHVCLLITVTLSFLMTFMGFNDIIRMIAPVLYVCYPTFIVLTLCNIAHKLWGFKWVKLPVYVTLAFSVFFSFIL